MFAIPNQITWHEPSPDDRRWLEGETPLVSVANKLGTWSHDGDENGFGQLEVTVDKDYTVTFMFNGGGPAPYDEWTIVYWNDCSRSIEHAKELAELAFNEVKNKTISPEIWVAHNFHKEEV